jgi:hypothetical protein
LTIVGGVDCATPPHTNTILDCGSLQGDSTRPSACEWSLGLITLRLSGVKKFAENFHFHKKGTKQVSAKKFVPNKKGDIGMWVGSHPKSYVTDQ